MRDILIASGIKGGILLAAPTAVDLVVGQIQQGERGLPPQPKVVLVEGEWVDGATTALRR